MDFSSV